LDEVDDDGDDEEMEVVERTDARQTEKVVTPADLAEYIMVTLPRRRLGRWCNEPFFEGAVKNCYVKLFIGEDENGKRCYRLCRIVGVKKSPSGTYSLPPVKKEKPVSTDKMLQLAFGANEKIFPIRLVSDAKPTEADVKQYVAAMHTARMPDQILGKREATKLRTKQDELINTYTYTTEDIENSLNAKKQKGQSAANLGLEQTRAAISVQGAQDSLSAAKARRKAAVDSQAINEAEEEIKIATQRLEQRLLEEERIQEKAKNRKERLNNRSTDQKWAKVNRKAVTMNQKADADAFKTKDSFSDKSSSAKPAFNPYARRKVKPKILWEVGQKDENKEGDEKKDSDAANGTEATLDKDVEAPPPLVQEQLAKAAKLSQSHQFAIDEEILAQTSFTGGNIGLTARKNARRVRKGLSLAEYQERRTAGTL
jgi:RNA polymerase-associated protein RTF1